MSDPKVLSNDEVFEMLRRKAQADGDDFRIRVFRKKAIGLMPEGILTVDGASVIHAVQPETWLAKLCGGGPIFQLAVYHTSDPSNPIGGYITHSISGDAINVIDHSIVTQVGWQGPRKIIYPESPASIAAGAQHTYAALGGNPPPALVRGVAPQTSIPTTGQPGVSSSEAAVWQQLQSMKQALDLRERQLDEERMKMREDATRRETDARFAQIERQNVELKQLIVESRTAAKADPVGSIGAVIAAVGPIVSQMMANNSALRLEMMKMDASRAEHQTKMLEASLARPLIDPAIQHILDKSSKDTTPQAEMLKSMAAVMHSMTETQMSYIRTLADLNLGGADQDPVMLKALREGMKGVQALVDGYRASVTAGLGVRPPVPPPHAAQAAPAPALLPAKSNGASARGTQTLAQGAVATGPQVPSSAPVAPSAESFLSTMDTRIKAKEDVGGIADTFVDALKGDHPNEELITALEAVDGDPRELFARRLGPWATSDLSNVPYAKTLLDAINEKGLAAGIFEPDGPESADVAE